MRPFCVFAAVFVAAAGAHAEGEADVKNGVSVRVLGGAVDVKGEGADVIVGAGVAYERDFYDLVAVELALEALTSPRAQTYIAEIVVEKPLELSDWLGLYFGAGPTAGVEVRGGRAVGGGGGLAVVGAEWFIAGGFELFVELDSAFLWFDRPVIEADVGTGVLYRF